MDHRMHHQYSPKSSPMGARSPIVTAAHHAAMQQQMDMGQQQPQQPPSGLKMTISLNKKSPFHLMRQEPTPTNEMTGATNLMAARGLEHSYQKLTTKKMKDSLSSFLPNMPGVIDTPGAQDNSSLRGIIEKPPVGNKELHPLNQLQLSAFRLHPGPLPEQYRLSMVPAAKKRSKKKKAKYSREFESSAGILAGTDGEARSSSGAVGGSMGMGGLAGSLGGSGLGAGEDASSTGGDRGEKRREKKHKKHDKDADERKKKKKEKKKKRNKEDKDL